LSEVPLGYVSPISYVSFTPLARSIVMTRFPIFSNVSPELSFPNPHANPGKLPTSSTVCTVRPWDYGMLTPLAVFIFLFSPTLRVHVSNSVSAAVDPPPLTTMRLNGAPPSPVNRKRPAKSDFFNRAKV
jgi:hypothetical protein